MRGCEQIPWLYDAFMHLAEPFGLGRWRRRLLDGARGRVLEVGCGTGRNLPLYPPGSRVVGLDVHLEVLPAARRRAPGVPLVVASAEALPFRPEVFDAVVSSLVFCSVPDPHRGLREIDRVLHHAGRLHMMEHVRHRGLRGHFQDWIQPAWTWFTGGCHPNRDTETTVAEAGFHVAEEDRRASGSMRLFTATRRRPRSSTSGR
jgi:ubiquinone/menaquinone biosynthesis C-methylase UbiE